MAASTLEGLRERWEKMNSREQRLVLVLSATLLLCLILALVAKVRGGMEEIEAKNAESRKALRSLALYRDAKARLEDTGEQIEIPEQAVALDSYLENIISELSLESPTYPAPKEVKMGENVELSFEVKFKSLDIYQLSDLLERVETGSKLVVIKELNVDTGFRDKEKVDLDMTIATYKKAAKKADKDEDEG